MKKITFITIILLLIAQLLFAGDTAKIDSLIIKGKKMMQQSLANWDENYLLQTRAHFERLLNHSDHDWLIYYYIALADYRLTSFHFSQQQKDNAKPFIEDGIEKLKKSIELNDEFAEAHSLLSSLYGNKIALNPLLGMTLGIKSGNEMSTAKKLEPENPRTHLIAGQSAYFTPRLFGGGKDKAATAFSNAIECYENYQLQNPLYPDWGREEAYSWLGIVQLDQEEYAAAKANFEKSLQINPDYGWVKYKLLPEVNKKMQ